MKKFLAWAQSRAKSLVVFIPVVAAGLLAATQHDSPGAESVTQGELLSIALTALAGQQFVFWTPNKDKEGTKQEESVQPPELGAGYEGV